ncbi:8328_t:CDS:2, partial [Ambispora gerdemannii]
LIMLQEEWVSIDLETLRELISSLPRCVEKLIRLGRTQCENSGRKLGGNENSG